MTFGDSTRYMLPVQVNTPGARFLLVGASFVVVVAGLREGATILLPFAMALFLAVMSMPLMFWLQVRRVPAPLAIAITMLVIGAAFGVLIMLGTQSLADFQDRLPIYQARFETLLDSQLAELTARFGVDPAEYQFSDYIDPSAVVGFFGSVAARIASFFTNTLGVLLIMAFILSEAMVFPFKFRAILGHRDGERRRVSTAVRTDRRRMSKIVREVQEYLGIKTLVSLVTGLLIGGLAWVAGLDFPVLLGLIGFVLNYVPTVGSFIAAVPALLLSAVQIGTLSNFMLLVVGYGTINMVIGNIIEPNLLGRRLGLSTLVVILSLLFWMWVWGPVGALLAVPLTMVVKIMVENTEDLRWVAILLDKSPPQVVANIPVPNSAIPPPTTSREVPGPTGHVDSTDAPSGDVEVA
jgi:AI-2 transport protein TqsA